MASPPVMTTRRALRRVAPPRRGVFGAVGFGTPRTFRPRGAGAPSATAPGDRTRDRVAILNQLLLASVVFILTLAIALDTLPGDSGVFFAGAFAVFTLTAVCLIVPWNSIRYGWIAVVPSVDIVAIGLMHVSSPESGLGLLWVFPTTWLAAGFGLLGMLGVIVAVAGVGAMSLVDDRVPIGYETLLLPLVIFAVAATSYITARRTTAQRVLLARQAGLLHQVLERTRRQEREVTEVLDTVDFGVIRIAASGAVAVTNEAHGRLQQALRADDGSDEAAYRDDGVTLLPADELPLERALRGETFEGQLVWFGDPAGAQRALSVTARRVADPGGEDDGAVVVSRDVTSEVTALRARDDLVASVSHELRTPLTSILGYLDLVIDDPDVPQTARESLEIAERNAERLLGLIADILAASSSSTTAQLVISPEIVDAAAVLHHSAESLVPRAGEKGVLIDTTGLEPAFVWADPQRLRQVVDNLLTNAIKYNREGGTVHLGTTTEGASAWLVVRDTGVGISETDRAKVFQRFYRGRTVRHSGMAGTGLGLSISRDIVRAHGGEIVVRSTLGVGSTFLVKLPSAASHESMEGAIR